MGVPVVVPSRPVVAPLSPSIQGTICVFLAAALMPVPRAAVVPTSVGALVRKVRAIEAVSVAFLPRPRPLTRTRPPLARARVPIVRVERLVAP